MDTRTTEETFFQLSRSIGRLASTQRTWLRMALRETLSIEVEWYFFLHTIAEKKEIRKTDIISINLILEPTTGIDILNRMLRAGLITEKIDPSDKRARLIRITAKGRSKLTAAEKIAREIAHKIFGHLEEKEIKRLEEILTPVAQHASDTIRLIAS